MTAHTLDGHLGRSVAIDACQACQVFWFDRGESLQLAPRATLQLFQLIGEQAGTRRHALAAVVKCPTCAAQLVRTNDMQRNVSFQYQRCPHGHGRLTTYFDFLREKNFIRPLSPAQIAELRQNVAAVNCSNCGAPIDLAKASACAHCGSALSMLDVTQAGAVIDQLQKADATGRPIDPALPLRLEQARREVDIAFAELARQPGHFGTSSSTDLVGAGLALLARWLKP